MPIYEFECQTCNKISEFSLKLADPYPTQCPACGEQKLQKIVSRTAFLLQGGGWYNEAYSKKPPADAAKPATPAAAGSESATPATATPAASPAPAATPASTSTATKTDK